MLVCMYAHVQCFCNASVCTCVCVCLLHSILLTFGLLQGLSYKKEVVLTTGQGGRCTLYPFTVNHMVARINLVFAPLMFEALHQHYHRQKGRTVWEVHYLGSPYLWPADGQLPLHQVWITFCPLTWAGS